MDPLFSTPDLFDRLESLAPEELDHLSFGVIAMDREGKVTAYNEPEAAFSGLTASRVIGRHFFTSVAPCTNNYLVAHRFENEPSLDDIIQYVFTLRMSPTPVHLRLLKRPDAAQMYLVVQRRSGDAA